MARSSDSPIKKQRDLAALKERNAGKPTTGKGRNKHYPVDKPLTFKEKRLVEEIALGNSGWAAAVRAGYENTPNLAKNIYAVINAPNVQAALARERAKVAETKHFTRERAMSMLMEAFDMGKLMAEPMAMVGATREMIKMAGYNAPTKVELSVNGNVQIEQLNRLSDADLLKIMEQTQLPEMLQQAVVPALDAPSEDAEEPE